mmetsp:Transcript_5964/g.7341  ORF Transcript_5964/g.7341 Transcript_5964/m.7341 type:complete len:230 (+) Transcript_5964:87-776(+)
MDVVNDNKSTIISLPSELEVDDEEANNETASPSGSSNNKSSCCLIMLIIILSLQRVGVGSLMINIPSDYYSIGGILFLVPISEAIEFVYYQSVITYIKDDNERRKVGPRGKKKGANLIIFSSFIISSIVLFIVGGTSGLTLLPMLIWIIAGNGYETFLLIQHKVDGERNYFLILSKLFVIVANVLFIIALESISRLLSIRYLFEGFCIASGTLYLLHGITLCIGLLDYY